MSNRCLVSSIKMLKTVHQRCVMRMRVSPINVRVRMGDAIGPFQLANGFEAVIGYECQERSNPLSSYGASESAVIFASVTVTVCVCVFITAGPITKLFAGGGGGEWTTCAMIDDEPRPVWMSPLVTHWDP